MRTQQVSTARLSEKLDQLGFGLEGPASSTAYVTVDEAPNLRVLTIGLGMEETLYDPDRFPGLLYRVFEDDTATAVFFENGTIVVICSSTKTADQVLDDVIEEVVGLGLMDDSEILSEVQTDPSGIPAPENFVTSETWDPESLFDDLEAKVTAEPDEEREPDISFSGNGSLISDSFEIPGGQIFYRVEVEESDRVEITAVGERSDDVSLAWATGSSPMTHHRVDRFKPGTYRLNVNASDESGRWRVDFFFQPPPPKLLPYETSGVGDQVIGPFPYEGFVRLTVTNHSSRQMAVSPHNTQFTNHLRGIIVDSARAESGRTKEEVISTVGDSERYPWLVIESYGEWEISVEADG